MAPRSARPGASFHNLSRWYRWNDNGKIRLVRAGSCVILWNMVDRGGGSPSHGYEFPKVTLVGKSIVVSGGGTGIGRCITECAAGCGASVTVVGRRESVLNELAERIGSGIHVVCAEIGAEGTAERILKSVLDRFGALDGLVNNAGLARFGRLEEADSSDLDAMLATNVRGPAELIRVALPQLRVRGGSVVNVTSVAGVLSTPGRAYYGATKAAMNSLTRSLARELAPEVRVNAVMPGPIDTPMWHESGMTDLQIQKLRTEVVQSTPMGRFGHGDDVARVVCCLLDKEFSGWITGALIPVDGGRTT